jgi:phosphoglycolate phosphatase-like HAD superfamily hydrolase
METVAKKILTPERTQANGNKFIKRWKEEKEKSQREAEAYAKTPEFKEILKRLKEANAKRGIFIPGV